MIEAGLEFEASDRRLIVESLISLPEELRPTHQSMNEDKRGEEIQSYEKLIHAVMNRDVGILLKNDNVTYDISIAGQKSIICNCFLGLDFPLAKNLLIHMARAMPNFGFSCAPEEREWRNRVVTKQGVNTIESWVGRDTQRYVPGFYWLTLLPAALAQKHNVPIDVVKSIALEHMELEGGQHFFRFYEKPEDWRATTSVADLCASLAGVFDVEKARRQLAAAKNFFELHAILQNWK